MPNQPQNPFISLEAAVEHIQSCRISLTAHKTATSPEYHLDAAEEALRRLFQSLCLLLPAEHRDYDDED